MATILTLAHSTSHWAMSIQRKQGSLFIAGVLLWALGCSTSGGRGTLDVPSHFADTVRQAEILGLRLFRHDQAAAVATDVVKARSNTDPVPPVQGWITEEQDTAIVVTFVAPAAHDGMSALYEVRVPSNQGIVPSVKEFRPPLPLSSAQAMQFRARQLAIISQALPCSTAYNTVVLPTKTGDVDVWHVYLLPGMTRHRILPASGYRVEVDAAGTKILGRRMFTRSCIELEDPPDAVALMITHMLDPSPTELHVFLSLLVKKPLLVATSNNSYGWEIRNGKVIAAAPLK